MALAATTIITACTTAPSAEKTLKEAFDGKFLMGCAINVEQSSGRDTVGDSIIGRHFNSIVPENCMKCMYLHPEEQRFFWDEADDFVRFGEERGMFIVGHCLLWHSQCAPWFFVDEKGNEVSADVLRQRIKDHISTIVGRYKGRVKGWDVVNEIIEDDGTWRQSPLYRIMGEEFVTWAFQCAHEADPDAELYLNDYSMAKPAKREAYLRLIDKLKHYGLRVDAIGLQVHVGLDYPDMNELERSMQDFIATGLKIQFTELDVNALPNVFEEGNENAAVENDIAYNQRMNPYTEGLPDSVQQLWNARLQAMFDLALKYSDRMNRVTMWGVYDQQSWLNDWPMKGRTNYPLLFDRNYKLKEAMGKYLK